MLENNNKMLDNNNNIRKDLAAVKELVAQETHPGENRDKDRHSHSGSITTEPAVRNEAGTIGQDVTSAHEGNRVEIIVLGDDEASSSNEVMGEREHLLGLSEESLRDLIIKLEGNIATSAKNLEDHKKVLENMKLKYGQNQVWFEQDQKVKKFRRLHLVYKEKTEGKIKNVRKELRKKEAIKRRNGVGNS